MYSSEFFRIKPIARLILKHEILGSHMISDQSLLLSTIVLNDSTNIMFNNSMCDPVALCVLKDVTTLQSKILYHRDIIIIMTFFIPASKFF